MPNLNKIEVRNRVGADPHKLIFFVLVHNFRADSR